MNRNRQKKCFCSLVGILILAMTGFAADGSRPNVILIMSDDTGYEVFGCYGSRQYQTPHIDKLAETGMRFNHCYAQPLCTPSRVKIMTGKSNVRNYVTFGILDKSQKTIGQMMKDAGYATCIAGKWQLYSLKAQYGEKFLKTLDPSVNVRGTLPEEAGFDEHCLWQVDSNGPGSRFWQPIIRVNGEEKAFSDDDDYGPNICTDYICEFIERNSDKPFFVYYPMILTHGPFFPTPKSADRAEKDKQKNFEDMVAYMDTLIGRIVDKLDETGVRNNTLILFIGDNGSPGVKSELNGTVVVGGKGSTRDAGTRVALVANMPGTVKAGSVSDDLVDFSDMMPTVAGFTGAELPDSGKIDGVSFAPQLKGEKGTPREWIYCYYENGLIWRGKVTSRKTVFARNHRWKLYSNGRLYDIKNDVLEKKPVTGKDEIRKKLQEVLDSFPKDGEMIQRFQFNEDGLLEYAD